MEEKPFRVLLDFSEVNTGSLGLKYVWMHVSPRVFHTIYDFKQAIARKFSFSQEGFKLFVGDGLLLETEKIAILREGDIIKIQCEAFCETSMECIAVDPGINTSVAEASCHSRINNAVGLSKSRKRKSDAFIAASRETEDESVSVSHSKKKKKQDKTTCISTSVYRIDEPSINISSEDLSGSRKKKRQVETVCISDESTSFSRMDELSTNQSQDLSGLDKNSKSNTSRNKSNMHSGKKKSNPYPKTPTSEFIKFAVKLSEPERMSQDVSQADVTATNSMRIKDNVTGINLCKTGEIVSKTSLSPIPEQSAYELSNDTAPLNMTEVSNVSDSQIDEKNSRKRKRRRRKRKIIPTTEDLGSAMEMEGSFLTDVTSNETYNASTDARKHIIFHSPTPLETGATVALVSSTESNFDEPTELPFEKSSLKGTAELDSSKDKSLKEDSLLDDKVNKESINSEMEDSTKESTPFSKTKSMGKSWGVTPLPRIGSSSRTFSIENSDISSTDCTKPAYQGCTPLNCLPPVGTRLAYKTLELNEEYCPEVTEYKEGIITKVDPNTDELEIELIQEEIKPGRAGKFENLWKDEPLPDDRVIKTVSLNWSALIDPRLIPFPK